jgi:hypothetical protein
MNSQASTQGQHDVHPKIPAEPEGPEQITTTKLVTALELKLACEQHQQKHCYIKRSGEHRFLAQAEIARWALMIVST